MGRKLTSPQVCFHVAPSVWTVVLFYTSCSCVRVWLHSSLGTVCPLKALTQHRCSFLKERFRWSVVCTLRLFLSTSSSWRKGQRCYYQLFSDIEKKKEKKINPELQDPKPRSLIINLLCCRLPSLFWKEGQSNCKYDLRFWEHLNGNTQAITFLSRSLNTNQTCILIGLPVWLMAGRVARRVRFSSNGRMFTLSPFLRNRAGRNCSIFRTISSLSCTI